MSFRGWFWLFVVAALTIIWTAVCMTVMQAIQQLLIP